MNLEETKSLCQGDVILDIYNARWKILKITTWKRSPNKILISCKHGLYAFAKFREHDLHLIKGKE